VLDHLPARARVVLDVGCGNGRFLARIRQHRPDLTALGLDIAAGILSDVSGPVAVGDAAHLPVRKGAISAVLAMHMLYHVRNLREALTEMVRVLEPGGVLIASTNAREDKVELDELWAAAAGDVLGVADPPRRVSLSARLPLDESPDLLRPYFGRVEVIELAGVVAVDDPTPVAAHLASYRAWADQLGVPFDATVERARVLVTERIEPEGFFRIRCRGGIVVGRSG
jgi:SAM-dependent methyltransferase